MSDKIKKINLSMDEIRTIVLEAFKEEPESQYVNICCKVAEIAVRKGIVLDPNEGRGYYSTGFIYLDESDKEIVREIIWNLVVENIVTIGINSGNESWPWLKLTQYGKKVIESEAPVPHDPSGYLKRLSIEIPHIDNVIRIYLEEAIKTYNINALLSSTIALGCASEKALLLLIEAYTNSITDSTKQKRFEEKTKGRMIKRQFEEIIKVLNGISSTMPGDIVDGLNNVMLGVFEMLRNYRNDAGHPTGRIIAKEQQFANLQVFIPYCKKIYQLIDYFNSNPTV